MARNVHAQVTVFTKDGHGRRFGGLSGRAQDNVETAAALADAVALAVTAPDVHVVVVDLEPAANDEDDGGPISQRGIALTRR